MARTFDGRILFGQGKNKWAVPVNLGGLIKAAGREAAPAIADPEVARKVQRKLADLEVELTDSLAKLGGKAMMRLGLSRNDLIVHLKSSDANVREEIFYVVQRNFAAKLVPEPDGARPAAAAPQPREKVVVLQPDDETIKADAPRFEQLGAKLKTVEQWTQPGAKQVDPTQAIGLFAHGDRNCPDKNLVVGKSLAGKDAKAIADLVRPRLPKDYRGTISLYGCFTGAGLAFGDRDLAFAKQVQLLLRGDFPAVRVRGVPDAWKLDDKGQMQMHNHVAVAKKTSSGLTTKPIEKTPAFQAAAKAFQQATRLFDDFAGPALKGLYVVEQGWWEPNEWNIDDWPTFVKLVDKVAARYPQAREVAKRYAIMEAVHARLRPAMHKPQIQNFTRTFRDKAPK